MSAVPHNVTPGGTVSESPSTLQNVPFLRSPYNYDRKAASDASGIPPGGPSLTVQSQADDADLNVLMKRFGVTGKIPEGVRIPTYGDYIDVGDFRSSLDAIRDAQDNFDLLPVDVKIKFEQNPNLFLSFCDAAIAGNMDNRKYLSDVGLAKPLAVAVESSSSVVATAKPEAQGGDVKK